jgi:regulator of protease activity HflC (stomatin/prohibitin superfamily)
LILPLALALVILVALLAVSIKVASEYERAIIFRLGRLVPEPKGPGVFLVVPLIDRILRVDLTRETLAEAVEAHRFVGEDAVVESDGTVRIQTGAPWPARSTDGAALVPGTRGRVERVEDDLTLVVGSVSSPTGEEPS